VRDHLQKGNAIAASYMLLPGKAGGTVAVRRTLASTICRIADPTQVPRPRQLRDASTVMRFQPAHQSMINRRFDDRAPCLAWMSPKQALAGKPRIHSPASGIGGHESGKNLTAGTGASMLGYPQSGKPVFRGTLVIPHDAAARRGNRFGAAFWPPRVLFWSLPGENCPLGKSLRQATMNYEP